MVRLYEWATNLVRRISSVPDELVRLLLNDDEVPTTSQISISQVTGLSRRKPTISMALKEWQVVMQARKTQLESSYRQQLCHMQFFRCPDPDQLLHPFLSPRL